MTKKIKKMSFSVELTENDIVNAVSENYSDDQVFELIKKIDRCCYTDHLFDRLSKYFSKLSNDAGRYEDFCDECRGKGYYFIDHELRDCICNEPQIEYLSFNKRSKNKQRKGV